MKSTNQKTQPKKLEELVGEYLYLLEEMSNLTMEDQRFLIESLEDLVTEVRGEGAYFTHMFLNELKAIPHAPVHIRLAR